MSASELMKALDDLAEANKAHRDELDRSVAKIEKRVDQLTDRTETVEAQSDRPGKTAGSKSRPEHKALDEFARTGKLETKEMSIAGGAAAGEALVPEFIANEILDQALGL